MSSENPKINDTYYVPFWVILQFLDATPPNPFIKATIKSIYDRNSIGPDGPVVVKFCEIICDDKELMVATVPIEYLINTEDLPWMASKIAEWFTNLEYINNDKHRHT